MEEKRAKKRQIAPPVARPNSTAPTFSQQLTPEAGIERRYQ